MASKRVLILGATFDPPHQGHVEILRAALKAFGPYEKVLVLVSGTPPHKKSMTHFDLRLRMAELAFASLGAEVEIDSREAKRHGPSYTVDTLVEMKTQDHFEFIDFIIGEDSAEQISLWKQSDQLKSLARFLVAPRTSVEKALEILHQKISEGFSMELIPMKPLEISSSWIREHWGTPQASSFLPREVEVFLTKNHIYGKQRASMSSKKEQILKSLGQSTSSEPSPEALRSNIQKVRKVLAVESEEITATRDSQASLRRKALKAGAAPLPLDESLYQKALQCIRLIVDKKGFQISLLNVTGLTPLADCFVLASGQSEKQVQAIADEVHVAMKKTDAVVRIEGYEEGRWVLVDTGDIIIHVFHESIRDYYRFDELWTHGQALNIPQEIYT